MPYLVYNYKENKPTIFIIHIFTLSTIEIEYQFKRNFVSHSKVLSYPPPSTFIELNYLPFS